MAEPNDHLSNKEEPQQPANQKEPLPSVEPPFQPETAPLAQPTPSIDVTKEEQEDQKEQELSEFDANQEIPFSEAASLATPTLPQEEQTDQAPPAQEEVTTPPVPDQEEEAEPLLPESTPLVEPPVVDFNFLETESRWLVKVLTGPNAGAEFALHGGSAYIIGTDPNQCDIIFHDMSISRKHARITIDSKENALIEDIDSRNGIFIEGKKITSHQATGTVVITMGTTTFALIDRTEEQKTIFAQAAPQEEKASTAAPTKANVQPQAPVEIPETKMQPIREATIPTLQAEIEKVKEQSIEKKGLFTSPSRLIALISAIVLILGIGFGTTLLFRTETITTPTVSHPQEIITQTLKTFPAVRFSYNPATKHLLLVGHVLTSEDLTRMLDMIQQLPFITDINSSGVVIDEFVWREMNQIIAKNPAWRGISLSSPEAGRFILRGFLKTKAMNEELLEYLSQNFPYMNLLQQNVVVEEELIQQVNRELAQGGFQGVKASLMNGELLLTGAISFEKKEQFDKLLSKFRSLAGVRSLQSQVMESNKSEAVIDLTSKYHITGYSQQKGNVSVVINGRILSRGDLLDGMLIVDITPTTIFLEHNGVMYKIDYIK